MFVFFDLQTIHDCYPENPGRDCYVGTTAPPTTTAAPTTTADPNAFDCAADAESWETAWSEEKKSHCCTHFSIGCTTTTTTTSTTATTTTTTATTTTTPFDCTQGLQNWYTGWSSAKIQYCCEVENVGCTTTTAPTPKPAFGIMDKINSAARCASCMTDEEPFCGTTKECGSGGVCDTSVYCESDFCDYLPVGGDCVGFIFGQLGRIHDCYPEQAGEDCYLHGTTTEDPAQATTTPLFYCDQGAANAAAGWSDEKKTYCCENENVGC